MRIAILGCGPAGLMATHAVAREEVTFDVYTDVIKPSKIGGAQYLHMAIPGLTEADPDGRIQVVKRGTAAGYASKIGRTGHGTSWQSFEPGFMGVWNLQAAYERLWTVYSNSIAELQVKPEVLPHLLEFYDVVISTIPKKALCEKGHLFEFQRAWIRMGELGVQTDSMIYDGTPSVPWYRSSNIFNSQSKEYPVEYPSARAVSKPLWNNCDCHPEVFTLGRYGKWEKRWLTSDAYTGARDIVRRLGG